MSISIPTSFAVLVFLFPTVCAYHLLSALVYLALLATQSVLTLLLLVLEDFPWYELVISVASPRSLQGGVRFRPLESSNEDVARVGGCRTATFLLEPQPAALAPFFARHCEVTAALLRQCSVGHLVRCLLLGRDALPEPERDALLDFPPSRSRRTRTHEKPIGNRAHAH